MSIRENLKSIPRVLTDLGIADGNPAEVLSTDGAGTFSFVAETTSTDATRVYFNANAGEALTKGDPVYISGVSGNKPVVMIADSGDPAKMPAFGLASTSVSLNANVEITTFGTLANIKTDYAGWVLGDTLYVQGGSLDNEKPSGETGLIQNLGKIQRIHSSSGSIKVGGAGRINDTPNLNEGNIFIGDVTNHQVTSSLVTEVSSIVNTGSWLTNKERVNLPEAPGNTVEYIGWCPENSELVGVDIYSSVINTVGTLTVDVENVVAGISSLSFVIDMNGLTSQTVTSVALSGVAGATTYAANSVWKISIVSSDLSMDGNGFYILLNFKRTI
jgi:hypothetical protein